MELVPVQYELFTNVLTVKTTQVTSSPIIKWVGGKSQLLRQFAQFFPAQFNRYYEPFLGGGAVFFHLHPDNATLSDINPNLMALYQHVKTHTDELLSILYRLRFKYHAMSPKEQEQEFYRVRERYNQLKAGDIEKSALFVFLNKTGFNGLYRENSKGDFNVPFGRYDNPAMFDEVNLRAVSRTLQGAELLTGSFSDAVKTAQAGDFVYFDPPYAPLSKTAYFTSYTKDTFGPDKQSELAEVARQLAARGVLVMLSNSSCEVIRELYHDFNQFDVRASRAINSKPDLRGKINELLITSYPV